MSPTKPGLLRTSAAGGHKVTNIELFFDLVFVFAVTQLSHSLLGHLTLLGAAQTAVLFLAVWWVWIYTSWVTNWMDPDQPTVRVMLLVLMLAGMLLSASLPHAFDSEGLLFAIAYVSMQVGRTLFVLWALRRSKLALRRNFQRMILWLLVSGVFWIWGALAQGEMRMGLWILAVAIEYGSVSIGFWFPGLGRSETTDWDIDGAHLAERCSLFVLIALGESVLVTGATAAAHPATAPNIAAFVVAFVGNVAMWWIYFNIGMERGAHLIAHAKDPGQLGRLAYTYGHLPIVGGIVVCAVADELVLAHPLGHIDLHAIVPIIAGPALFLAGNLWFKKLTAAHAPLSHIVGLGLLVLAAAAANVMSPLLLGAITSVILILVAAWETISLRPR